MIAASFAAALAQSGDRRFLGVTVMGVALSILLLAALYALLAFMVAWLAPDSVTLPWWGEVTFFRGLLEGASLFLVLVLSVFLMVPVAVLFCGFFLDRVAEAVEDEHFPSLGPARRQSTIQALMASIGFALVVVIANVAGLVLYLLAGPFAPLVFVGLNGWLIGREYFDLAAARRVGPAEAKILRRRNARTIWAAGMLLCAPLAVPVVNLFVPVIGAATFTHLFHAIWKRDGDARFR